MKSTKTDNRSRFTQMIVKQALLNLMQEKTINEITIKQICELAEITRSTFYNNFYDIYDVLESIEEEFYNKIKDKIDIVKIYYENNFFYDLMLLIYENQDIAKIIVNDVSNSYFLKRITKYVKNKFLTDYQDMLQNMHKDIAESVFTFTANGSISIICEWIDTGLKTPIEEIAQIVQKLNMAVFELFKKSK